MDMSQGRSMHHLDGNPHEQFCRLSGVPITNPQLDAKSSSLPIGYKSLYDRATRQYAKSKRNHMFLATLSNIFLLSQVMIGAVLTALGASNSSHILVTVFGAMNTVIAGSVAYLKSRGQPMRLRMYRDDLERVVEEIENSEVMWLGISENDLGYDDIDIHSKVTVRSEMGRLTRLFEAAQRNNTANSPDNYFNGTAPASGPMLRSGPVGGQQQQSLSGTSQSQTLVQEKSTSPQPLDAALDPDESPVTAIKLLKSEVTNDSVGTKTLG